MSPLQMVLHEHLPASLHCFIFFVVCTSPKVPRLSVDVFAALTRARISSARYSLSSNIVSGTYSTFSKYLLGEQTIEKVIGRVRPEISGSSPDSATHQLLCETFSKLFKFSDPHFLIYKIRVLELAKERANDLKARLRKIT